MMHPLKKKRALQMQIQVIAFIGRSQNFILGSQTSHVLSSLSSGSGKVPCLWFRFEHRVRRERSEEPVPESMARAAKLAGKVGLHLCAWTAVSIYNSLGTAASITPVCCDPGGNAQTERTVRGGWLRLSVSWLLHLSAVIFSEMSVKYEALHVQ